MPNDLIACCVHDGKTGTDDSAKSVYRLGKTENYSIALSHPGSQTLVHWINTVRWPTGHKLPSHAHTFGFWVVPNW